MRTANTIHNEYEVQIQRVIETAVPVFNGLEVCVFLSSDGKDKVIEPIIDMDRYRELFPWPMLALLFSMEHGFREGINKYWWSDYDSFFDKNYTTMVITWKACYHPCIEDGLDLLKSQATQTQSQSRIDGLFSSRSNKQLENE